MTTITPNEAFVGMPATFAIGSDAYATEITAVYRYTTGTRKGQVKAVDAGRYGYFTLRTTGHKAGYLVRQGGNSGTLRLGVAESYWDPSF
jgi:streptogramin lyase